MTLEKDKLDFFYELSKFSQDRTVCLVLVIFWPNHIVLVPDGRTKRFFRKTLKISRESKTQYSVKAMSKSPDHMVKNTLRFWNHKILNQEQNYVHWSEASCA
jgi:hypothetical protein